VNAPARSARRRTAATALATLGALALGALATHATAANDPGGYVGKGQLVVQTALPGVDKLTVGGDIALEQRGSLLRLDVLSLGIPGADAAISSVLSTQLFPPGGFTIVYDRKTSTYTLWSSGKRSYYSSAATPASASKSTAAPAPLSEAIGVAGDLFAPLAFAKAFRNDAAFTASLSLAGHGPVNGHPATGLDYQYARTTKSGDKTDVHGRLQLADDLDEAPVEITASMKSKSIPASSLRLDLTTLVKQTPNDADFSVPPGYSRASDVGAVLGRTFSQ